MKPTKEQIIEIGLAVVTDIFKETHNEKTITAEQEPVKIYTESQKEYYQHDGWLFTVESKEKYENEAITFLLKLLDNGMPISIVSVLENDKPRTIYVIKDENGKYRSTDKLAYLKHHSFDFTKGFTKKKFEF
jgi:hypothetical protein